MRVHRSGLAEATASTIVFMGTIATTANRRPTVRFAALLLVGLIFVAFLVFPILTYPWLLNKAVLLTAGTSRNGLRLRAPFSRGPSGTPGKAPACGRDHVGLDDRVRRHWAGRSLVPLGSNQDETGIAGVGH